MSINATEVVRKESQIKTLLVPEHVQGSSWASLEGPITCKGGGHLKEVLLHTAAAWMRELH